MVGRDELVEILNSKDNCRPLGIQLCVVLLFSSRSICEANTIAASYRPAILLGKNCPDAIQRSVT